MPRPMPPHTLMVGSQLVAAATAIFALPHMAVAPLQTPGRKAKLSLSAASFFLLLQCFLGPARRRSSSSLVRYGSWVAYHAPFYLATYATGNLYMLSSHEELDILAWGIVLFHALESMPPMAVYYGGDYGNMWSKMNKARSLGYIAIVFHAVYVTKTCTVMSFLFLLAYVLLCTAGKRVCLPIHLSGLLNNDAPAVMSGEEDFAKLHAAVSDEEESTKLHQDDAHVAARAVMSGQEDSAKFHAAAPAPAAVSDKEDLVFSYKLFLRMLTPLDQEWLVTKAIELLSYEGGEDKFGTRIQSAFQVVEVQLAFLYDQFFTCSNTIVISMLDENPVVLAGCFVWPLIHGLTLTLYSRSGLALTALVLVLDWLTFVVPLARLWASDWGKAVFAERETQGKAAGPPFIDNLCNVINYFPVFNFTGKRYWQEMIGQYSLLQDYNRGNRWKAVVAQAVAIAQARWWPSMHHPREEEAASLPKDLKLRLGHSLASARHQGIRMTLQEESHANTILIWHIATCYFDMDPDYLVPDDSTSQANISYHIATKLSKYCAYLVAFLPELLPGDARATSEAFQSVVKGTRKVLGDAVDKHARMKTLFLVVGEHSSLPTFEAGVALAKQLHQGKFPATNTEAHQTSEGITAQKNPEEIEALWNVLADFWVKTLLYIAPCNSTAKHIDMLAQGGEFITHVWALLFNTGMIVRAPAH